MPARFRRRTITVQGKAWQIRVFDSLTPPGESEPMFGLCDYVARVLWIRRDQTEAELLDTLVHEVLHAAVPHLDERDVRRGAEAIAAALSACGIVGKGSARRSE